MPSTDFIIDLHVHPNYKPFGRSFETAPGTQSSNPNDRNSLWFYDPPTIIDKLLNIIGSLTKFSQSNFTAGAYGRLGIITVALGSIEKWFFNNKAGTGEITDILENFATEMGKPRIDAVQNMQNYFADLVMEFGFMEQMHNKAVEIDGKKYQYRIVNNFHELKAAMEENKEKIENNLNEEPFVIALVLSIEGMHVLNCGIDPDRSPQNIKANPDEVKQHAKRFKTTSKKAMVHNFLSSFLQ
jgi:hypothetical protein